MKILMINVTCGSGSTGRICTDLAQELEKNGHEVKIAYGRDAVPEKFKKYAIRIGTDFDLYMHVLRARLFDSMGLGSTSATRKFLKWVDEYDPDVIHLHNIHGYYINIKRLFEYLKASNKRIIWTLHDCWSFTGHTAYCDAVDCLSWKDGCLKCPLKKEYPRTFIDRAKRNWKLKKDLLSNIPNMTIVTPSEWLKNWVKRSFLQSYKIEIINNGIDTKQFYPIKSGFRKKYELEKKIILLGVSTEWNKMKGYYDYIKLAEELGENYKVVLVGLTETQLKKLPKNMLGIEKTSSIQELAEIYTAADLYLNLSYCENYPTVNIESMACGTPVLTYKTGGSPEIINKYGGYIVSKGNRSEIIDDIKELEKVEMKFNRYENDVSYMIEQYLELYNSAEI